MVRQTSFVGHKGLRKIQFGKEDAHGDGFSVASNGTISASSSRPTTRFMVGKLNMRLQQELYMPDDLDVGRLTSFERSQVIAREVSLPFEADASYEDLPVFLSMAVRDIAVPTGAAPYTWSYVPILNAANDPASFAVEYGDEKQAYRTAFVSCTQLELSGQVGDILKLNADLVGQDMIEIADFNPNTLTPDPRETVKMGTCELSVSNEWTAANSIAEITVNNAGTGYTSAPAVTIPAPTGTPASSREQATAIAEVSGGSIVRIIITNAGGGYTGTVQPTVAAPGAGTQATLNAAVLESGSYGAKTGATLVDFNYRVMTGFTPQKFADGRFYFTVLGEAKKHVETDLTVAFTDQTKDWFNDRYRGGTVSGDQDPIVLTFEFTGSNDRKLVLRTGGKITEFGELAEREGQDIVKIKHISELNLGTGQVFSAADSASGRDWGIQLVNRHNSLARAN